MRVLYLSRSKSGKPHPFIKEQADALSRNYNIEIQHFLIREGGVLGYSKAVFKLYEVIKEYKADLIHVHYGLWTFVAVLSKFLFLKKYKIVITFHGSDIYKGNERKLSLLGSRFSAHNILVSERMLPHFAQKYSVIPCGIDIDVELNLRDYTRRSYGWSENDFVVLFSSNFDRPIKDPRFAFTVIEQLSKVATKNVRFIELKGYTRSEVTALMQAADAMIMCSKSEGSPQVIKEAILNALPVVSNDVGDVKSICAGVDNCYILEKSVDQFVDCLLRLSQQNARVENRKPVLEKFDNNSISRQLYSIYNTVLA